MGLQNFSDSGEEQGACEEEKTWQLGEDYVQHVCKMCHVTDITVTAGHRLSSDSCEWCFSFCFNVACMHESNLTSFRRFKSSVTPKLAAIFSHWSILYAKIRSDYEHAALCVLPAMQMF